MALHGSWGGETRTLQWENWHLLLWLDPLLYFLRKAVTGFGLVQDQFCILPMWFNMVLVWFLGCWYRFVRFVWSIFKKIYIYILYDGFRSILAQCIQQWCRPHTFDCRCLLFPLFDMSFQFIWDGLPASCDLCKAQSIVCEISYVPPLWRARLKLVLDLMSVSSWMCFAVCFRASLQQGHELMVLERERLYIWYVDLYIVSIFTAYIDVFFLITVSIYFGSILCILPAEALVCFGRWRAGHFECLHRRSGWFCFEASSSDKRWSFNQDCQTFDTGWDRELVPPLKCVYVGLWSYMGPCAKVGRWYWWLCHRPWMSHRQRSSTISWLVRGNLWAAGLSAKSLA